MKNNLKQTTMPTPATTRKSTSLLKKHLKETFGIKTSVRSDFYSGGSSLRISYDLGVDPNAVNDMTSQLQMGHFNGMEDIYEYNNNKGLVVDGYQLESFKYVFVEQCIPTDFFQKMVMMFSDNFNFNGVDKLENVDSIHTSFKRMYGSSWNWRDLFYYFFKKRNFVTNNTEDITLLSCEVDGDLNNGIFFNYEVDGVKYNTKEFVLREKKVKKVTKKVTIKKTNSESTNLNIEVVDYSEKAIAVFGDSKVIKDDLKSIGGRFNRFLTNPKTQEKQAGWIFSKTKRENVLELIG